MVFVSASRRGGVEECRSVGMVAVVGKKGRISGRCKIMGRGAESSAGERVCRARRELNARSQVYQ